MLYTISYSYGVKLFGIFTEQQEAEEHAKRLSNFATVCIIEELPARAIIGQVGTSYTSC